MKKSYLSENIVLSPPLCNKCLYRLCSPYPEEEVGFNWLNYSYPFLHNHDHWEIFVVTSGNILHTINRQNAVLKKGDMCLICPDDNHKLEFLSENAEAQHISFLIRNDYMERLLACYGDQVSHIFKTRPIVTASTVSDEKLLNITNTVLNFKSFKMSTENKAFYCKILIGELINIIMKDQFKCVSQIPDWLSGFLFTLNNPYLQFNTMEELATLTPYSYSRLSRIFKETTGRTIHEYVARVKINHAKELLQRSDMTVLEIATHLGYDSISNFNCTFKSIVGTSPTQYRRSNLPL